MGFLLKDIFNGSKPQNGELTINLNLTIKVEADGSLSVTPGIQAGPAAAGAKDDMVRYEIPEFEMEKDKLLDFSKNK